MATKQNTQIQAVSDSGLPATPIDSPMVGTTMKFSNMNEVIEFSKIMATAKFAVPDIYLNNPGACMGVTMQAIRWGMDPFAVAQKTHQVSGKLGYEGQLVNAVVTALAPTTGRLQYEWYGEWDRILGKSKEIPSKKQEGTSFRVPDWKMEEEEGLGIRVSATLKGESEPRVLDLKLKQAQVRNSTLWASDPKQQLAYLAVKRWARLHCPDVLLGVYTPDELDAQHPAERDIGGGSDTPASPAPSRTQSLKNKLKGGGTDEPEDAEVAEPEPEPDSEELPLAASAEVLTVADITSAINDAENNADLDAIKPLMLAFAEIPGNEQFQEELGEAFRWKRSQLKPGRD